MMRLAAPGLLVAVGLFACAHRPEEPATTMASFGAALARGDLRAAYQLTSLGFQRRMPYEAFAAGVTAGGTEPAAVGQRLVAEAGARAPRVEVTLELGEQVPLVLEGGRWRIDGPVYEAWGQATPRAAVRTFIRALDARRYDVVLRLVPDRYRARPVGRWAAHVLGRGAKESAPGFPGAPPCCRAGAPHRNRRGGSTFGSARSRRETGAGGRTVEDRRS
jgi:hypothetical protein